MCEPLYFYLRLPLLYPAHAQSNRVCVWNRPSYNRKHAVQAAADAQPALRRTIADDIVDIARRNIPPARVHHSIIQCVSTAHSIIDLNFVRNQVMPQPPELHEVLLYVITYDLLSIRICHNLSKSAAKILHFLDMSDA